MDARAEPCLVLTVREEKDGEYETLWAPGGAGVRPARWEMHLNTLSLSPIVPFHVYVLFQCPISGGSWLSVTESFIPFHILSHPSSPLHSNRPRWSKCLTFVARMYYFKAPVLLSTGVLVYWFAVFQRRCASFYPVKLQFVCSWPQVLYICPNDTFAFWLCLPSSILT